MTLQFPTMAEKVLAEFRNAEKTVSLAVLAKRAGAIVERDWIKTFYIFEDDTSLEVTGRGAAHKVVVHLP